MREDEVSGLDLRSYLRVLRRQGWIIALTAFVAVAGAILVSRLQPKIYAGKAKVLLQSPRRDALFDQNTGQRNDPARTVQTEIEVLKSHEVRAAVRAELGVAPKVSARPVGQADVLEISARSRRPATAAAVANAYATTYIDFRRQQAVDDITMAEREVRSKIVELQQQVDGIDRQISTAPATQQESLRQSLNPQRDALIQQLFPFRQKLDQLQVEASLRTGGAQLITPASVPAGPASPRPARNVALALPLGLLLGAGLAFAREHLDESIKSKEDFQRAVPGLAVLGLIPLVTDWRARDQGRLVSLTDPTSQAAEAYRILRTSIQFLSLDRQVRLIQVTSASAQEGKTTTLANLAVAFASSGLRTVAVCCDLRRPRLHKFFDIENSVGFTSVLLGKVQLASALQPIPAQDRLLVLASGPLPPNPAELLSSSRTAELFRSLANQADVVLIDSPPVLPVTDSLVLSQRVDATVLVGSAGVTTRKAAARAAEMLLQLDAPVVGAVLNGVSEDSHYGSGYSYRYYTSEAVTADETANGNGTVEKVSRRGMKSRRSA